MTIEEKLRKVLESKIEEELVKGVEYVKRKLDKKREHLAAYIRGIEATVGYGEDHAIEIACASTASFGVNYEIENLGLVERKLRKAREEFDQGGSLREKIDGIEAVSCGILLGYLNHKEDKAWVANVLKSRYDDTSYSWVYKHIDSIRILELSRSGEFVFTVAGNNLSVYNSKSRKVLQAFFTEKIENRIFKNLLGAVENYNLKLLEEILCGGLPDYDYEWKREAEVKNAKRFLRD